MLPDGAEVVSFTKVVPGEQLVTERRNELDSRWIGSERTSIKSGSVSISISCL